MCHLRSLNLLHPRLRIRSRHQSLVAQCLWESSPETISLALVPSGKHLGLYAASLSNCSWRSLKRSSASARLQITFLLKIQFFNSSFGCNLSPSNVKHLHSIKYREFWKWFFLLYSLNQLFNRNRLIVSFQWSNWTIGWSFEVVLGGRNINSIDTRFSMDGWIGQLSTNRTSFCSSLIKRLSTSWTHSSNNMLSIQLFFWLRYRQGKCFICLKHQGFLDLPVTNYGNFSPTILAAVIPVWRSLLCLPPTQFSFFRCRDLFGWAQ